MRFGIGQGRFEVGGVQLREDVSFAEKGSVLEVGADANDASSHFRIERDLIVGADVALACYAGRVVLRDQLDHLGFNGARLAFSFFGFLGFDGKLKIAEYAEC